MGQAERRVYREPGDYVASLMFIYFFEESHDVFPTYLVFQKHGDVYLARNSE